MIQEIALTQLGLKDPANDTITNIGNIPMPQGTKFDDLVSASGLPFTFYWDKTSFNIPKPCVLRIVPSEITIGAIDNSVNPPAPYDVPCSDYSIFSLLGWHRHPDHRPK
jgi:hypothetical protein